MRSVASQARFRQGVDLVSLDVCARDGMGRPLMNLVADDFLVLENGKPQAVSIVMPSGAVPLTVVLLIDHSMSMDGPKLARAQEAARLFVGQLRPEDRLEIIAFNQQAKRVLAFDDAPSGAATALNSIRAWGTTSIYEALLVAANDLVRARAGAEPETREVIIVLSDGEDTASVVGFDEALPVVRRSGAIVYTLSLRTDAKGIWLGATWPLLELARDTGGRTLGVPALEKLPELYAEIAAEVRHLYRIGYVSNDERRDGQWRQVAVRVPTRDARVRTRAGYYAAGQRKQGDRR
ncbi:MAG: VWA domain-containing protein [Cyanobacteria bacterium]|nr:VWA domain-containing protein [Cyanobacteriota bacterium]